MAADFQRVKDIFLAAAEQTDPREREACLRQACGDDDALRRRVEVLLRRHDQARVVVEDDVLVRFQDAADVSRGPAAGAASGPRRGTNGRRRRATPWPAPPPSADWLSFPCGPAEVYLLSPRSPPPPPG